MLARDVRRAAAAVWQFRAHAEIEAAARFARLTDELSALGAAAPVIAMARAAAADERRHAVQCTELARRFGADMAAPRARFEAPPVAPRALRPRQRLLYEVVAMSCVTETLSAALLGEMVSRATDPVARRTMQQILRDEVGHARLGWAHLAAESRRGAAGFVAEHLGAMLAGTVSDELFALSDEDPALEALGGLGALDRVQRRRVFVATLEQVVFPGLERFDVETACGRRWLGETLARSREPQRTGASQGWSSS